MKFRTDKIEGGIRFTAPDGWVDLLIDGERANLWCGTFNGTPPEVFGNRLWHLLRDVVPELQLRVIAYDGDTDPFVESILVNAGFSKEGTRRQWGDGGQDQVIYSILAAEVRYEVTKDGNSISDAPGAGEATEILQATCGG